MNPFILVIVSSICTCCGNLCLKQSRITLSNHSLASMFFSFWFISSMFFYVAYVIFFSKALEQVPVSAAYPVLAGSGFGFIIVSSSYFFDERLNFSQWVGLGIILLGIIIMSGLVDRFVSP